MRGISILQMHDEPTPVVDHFDTGYARMILAGMQLKPDSQAYLCTVGYDERARRRKRNRIARASRKANRR